MGVPVVLTCERCGADARGDLGERGPTVVACACGHANPVVEDEITQAIRESSCLELDLRESDVTHVFFFGRLRESDG
jgi:hypothetical protein